MNAALTIIAIACAYSWGWVSSHQEVLRESERLGSFYVGDKVVIVKEVKKHEDRPSKD